MHGDRGGWGVDERAEELEGGFCGEEVRVSLCVVDADRVEKEEGVGDGDVERGNVDGECVGVVEGAGFELGGEFRVAECVGSARSGSVELDLHPGRDGCLGVSGQRVEDVWVDDEARDDVDVREVGVHQNFEDDGRVWVVLARALGEELEVWGDHSGL